ncbi:DUF1501 domain-containing protein [Stieleria sp. ICT_E10.1]|uniref:DUF1501 domain-containing protein n=1 Tax=Stieleria sedimenti TaxID=2976331 RepID=UPI0021803007|nr:DUF1501 domain-containing protein [Stieleria sedimenti]MCS7471089.1 DUF1501 domain-containing protein [Stieleria sedimenti]
MDSSTTRRHWLQQFGMGLGGIAASQLLQRDFAAAAPAVSPNGGVPSGGVINPTHHAPKAKRVIYLFQAGGPSQLETWDYKPLLNEKQGEPLPDSVRQGQRLTGMSGNQAILPLAGSMYKFNRHGENGTWVSELMPHMAKQVDQIAVVKSMYTEAINHDPAITFLQTGNQLSGRPSIGSWLHYGLGSENDNLPTFVVLVTKGKGGQPLYSRLWGSGFLPARYQGVQFRSGKEPVLYLANPPGISAGSRRNMLDRLNDLHQLEQDRLGDPALATRIEQYEMAYRMQSSVPDVANLADEPQSVKDLYGPDVSKPGSFAANCLLARRLAERGVRFIQLYHQGWDHHGNIPGGMKTQCRDTDQPSAALLQDLQQRGLLDDTLVIWGGEFGRTNYSQGTLTATNYGRDHHPRCFTMWMAGGGIQGGVNHGETCPFGYNVVSDGVHVRDFHATLLHLMGIDHHRLSVKFQGLDARLTGVEPARVVNEILA